MSVHVRSLAAKLLLLVAGLSALFMLVCGAASFVLFDQALLHSAKDTLLVRVTEKERAEAFVLDSVRLQQQAANQLLEAKLDEMSDAWVDRDFDFAFPEDADGVRRSRLALFDGVRLPSGQFVHGMAGFLPAGPVAQSDKKRVLAIFKTILQIGDSRGADAGLFGFSLSNGGILVFGPGAEDKLRSARGQKPSEREANRRIAQTFGPKSNPKRAALCQPLDFGHGDGKPMRAFCLSPVYAANSYLGGWGTILGVEHQLENPSNPDSGRTDLMVSSEGKVIAVAHGLQDVGPDREEQTRFGRILRWQELSARERIRKSATGVIDSADGRYLVAYAKTPAASWYVVSLTPKAPLAETAARNAFGMVAMGLVIATGLGLLLFLFTGRLVVRPLQHLAKSCRDPDALPGVTPFELRQDEIGALARGLADARARNQDLLSTLEERVAARTLELDRANRSKSVFLANISHELRTPLNGVVAISDLLRRRLPEGEEQRMAALVASSGKLLEQVLSDVLDMSKIEAGQMTLNCEPFSLRNCIDRIAELHRASATAKGIGLYWSISGPAMGAYLGDEVRLSQILSNLLSNAVKFTAKGRVSLLADRAGEQLVLTVTDTGIGFSAEAADRLFKRFEQADGTITRRFGGTGLGLSICAALCGQMGGSIEAAAKEGEGATFTVTLPLARAEDSEVVDSGPVSMPAAVVGSGPVRVLLAEDHPTNQKVVALILQTLSVDLTIVDNGAEAVEAYKQKTFDLVLMDMQMPVMDGLTATRAIRAWQAERGEHLPAMIVALTANALTEHIEAMAAAGASRHLTKPIRPDSLIELIEACRARLHLPPAVKTA